MSSSNDSTKRSKTFGKDHTSRQQPSPRGSIPTASLPVPHAPEECRELTRHTEVNMQQPGGLGAGGTALCSPQPSGRTRAPGGGGMRPPPPLQDTGHSHAHLQSNGGQF